MIGQDVGVYYGTTWPNVQFEAAINWLLTLSAETYMNAWAFLDNPFWTLIDFNATKPWLFQWPNGTCSPVYMPIVDGLKAPNATIVWCINSTVGYINLINWVYAFRSV